MIESIETNRKLYSDPQISRIGLILLIFIISICSYDTEGSSNSNDPIGHVRRVKATN